MVLSGKVYVVLFSSVFTVVDQAGSKQGVRPDPVYSCFPLRFILRMCLTDGHVKSVYPGSVSLDLRPNGKLGY